MDRSFAGRASLAAALLALGSSGCTADPTVTVTLTAAELQRELNRRLPLTRAGRLVTVTVQAAEVVLAEGSERIGVRALTAVQLPAGRALSGTAQLDGHLRYVPEQGEFWLDDARIVDLGIASIPAAIKPTVEELVGGIARAHLARTPVYRLKQENVKQSLARLVLRSVVVRGGKIVVVLGRPRGPMGGGAPGGSGRRQ